MPAFSCGVKDDFMFSLLIPTVLPMLSTASFLSPDSRNVKISSCWSLSTVALASSRRTSDTAIAPIIPSPSRPT
ncbi:Os03g0178066 [Oryza sativa Japonica Group]|uniref:Os03g0178066 protein n=1 Tax=Oryza sativa subsp. japonica TaxID=39947 RepID=A0A0N7KGP5_ORYSJ|nr:hypothetical protein EE612_015648 [Oryza sativa]BAS82593.1 Os03g0178066 [Oryza sativa Japonica Group]